MMRNFRRSLVWMALVGLGVALVLLQQRRGDAPVAAEAADNVRGPMEGARTAVEDAVASTSAASTVDSGDQAVAMCVQTLKAAEQFARSEHGTLAADPEPAGDELTVRLGSAQRGLAASSDPEHFLAGVLLDSLENRSARNPDAQTRLLDLGGRAAASHSRLLAWHALRACAEAKQFCPIVHLEQRLLEADRQNAESWAMVATLRYERGDAAGALAAMQGAARAPASTWYWTETISLIERSLAAQTTMLPAERMANAFGSAASAGLPTESGLLGMCKAESASRREWAEACLAFGTLRGERNETMAAQSIAYLIRQQASLALGNPELAEQVAAELARYRAETGALSREPAGAMTQLQWALIETDPARFQAYLSAVQQVGERAAPRMFLRQELPLLLERSGLLERDGARECVAQFFAGTRTAVAGQQVKAGDEVHVTLRGFSPRGEIGQNRTLKVRSDGVLALTPVLPRVAAADGSAARPSREILASGKTMPQLQREIATTLAEYYQSLQLGLTLLSPRSPEELRLEFDNARREAAEGRSRSR